MLHSVLYVCTQTTPLSSSQVEELLTYYQDGVMLYGIFANQGQIEALVGVLDEYLATRGLARNGEGFASFTNTQEVQCKETHFLMSRGSFHLLTTPSLVPNFIVKNGNLEEYTSVLEQLESTFDLAQFCGIYGKKELNILLDGQTGTGKTRSLLTRFLFLWQTATVSDDVFLETHKIIVFHDSLKGYYYKILKEMLYNGMISSDSRRFEEMYCQMEKIQLLQIVDLVKNHLVREDLRVIQDFELLNQIISQTTTLYLLHDPVKLQEMKKLKITFEEIETQLRSLVMTLFQENLSIATFSPNLFGKVDSQDQNGILKRFYHESAIEVGKLWLEALLSRGEIHQTQIISYFLSMPKEDSSQEVLLIDDIHRGTKGEIDALLTWRKGREITFVVSQNRNFFSPNQVENRIFYDSLLEGKTNLWYIVVLQRQYRMDQRLSAIVQSIFMSGKVDGKALSIRDYNHYLGEFPDKFYHPVSYHRDSDQIIAISDEIHRIQRRLDYEKEKSCGTQQSYSFAVIVMEDDVKLEIIRGLEGVGYKVEGSITINPVVSDILLLLKGVLYSYQESALYDLLQSRYFSLEIPRSNLYLIQKDANKAKEKNGVSDYLIELLNQLLQNQSALNENWEEIQENIIRNWFYIKKLCDILKPWEKQQSTIEDAQQYRENLEILWVVIAQEKIMNVSELYDFLCEKGHQIPFKRKDTDRNKQIILECLTYEESIGREFGHVLFLLDHFQKNINDSYSKVVNHGESQISYNFSYNKKNSYIKNGESLIHPNNTMENTIISLLSILGQSQFSFSWMYLESRKDDVIEKILRKGLENYGV